MSMDGTMASPQARAGWLDAARGVAVVAMVIYHLAWDLSHFGFVETDVGLDPRWKLFAGAIAAGFLAIAGVAQAFSVRGSVRWQPFLRRLGLIAGAAVLVSAASYALFPDRFIFFGILHCIALASVIGLAFARAPFWLTLAAGAVVLALPAAVRSSFFDGPALVWLGLGVRVPLTNDFVPVFPWAGWFLVGLGAGQRIGVPKAAGTGVSPLRRIGRWSLAIYLIHQPVLFGLFQAAGATGLVTLQTEVKAFVQSCAVDCETSGASERVCLAACACAARTLRDRPAWQRVVAGETTAGDDAELTMVGRRCYEAAQ